MAIDGPGLFITGTDTSVGKTFVAALIAQQLRSEGLVVGAYKPACSGAVETEDGSIWEDIEILFQATGERFDRDRICPQRFRAPLAPPVAARQEGRDVDFGLLRSGASWWAGRCDFLLVEGVGGLLCPLTESESVADFAGDLDLPLLVVATDTLGTINHTLLTVEVARRRGLNIAGVLLNDAAGEGDESTQSNLEEISRRAAVPVLGVVPHAESTRLPQLPIPLPGVRIDWQALACSARGRSA